jgi:hypothetical protein
MNPQLPIGDPDVADRLFPTVNPSVIAVAFCHVSFWAHARADEKSTKPIPINDERDSEVMELPLPA